MMDYLEAIIEGVKQNIKERYYNNDHYRNKYKNLVTIRNMGDTEVIKAIMKKLKPLRGCSKERLKTNLIITF